MKTRKPYEHYSDDLKKKAGELYDILDSKGRRVYSVKQIAKELGVPLNTAIYLEYSGRKLLGTRSRERMSRQKVRDSKNFVEENVEGFVSPKKELALLMLIPVIAGFIGLSYFINSLF